MASRVRRGEPVWRGTGHAWPNWRNGAGTSRWGATDASIVALLQRVGTDVVVSFDRRHKPSS